MYAAVSWEISPQSLNSAAIKQGISNSLGTRPRAAILAHFYVVRLASNADFDALAQGMEGVASAFPGEMDYVTIQTGPQGPVFRPELAARPGWPTHVISGVIS